MRTRTLALTVAAIAVAIVLAVLGTDVVVRWKPERDFGTAAIIAAAPDLDAYLKAREDSVPGVKPYLRKGIIWRDAKTHARTPIALVYLHGFSASRGELSPVVEQVADSLGANVFFTRLAAHGRYDGEAFATVTPQAWIDDAREALAIGHRIGERVVVVGMSTGALLAIELAREHPDSTGPAALVLASPNYAPADKRAQFMVGPFGPTLIRLAVGRYREFPTSGPAHADLWTARYRSEGVVAMMELVRYARGIDVSKIMVPVQTLYTHFDDVVNVDLIRSRHAEFGARLKVITDVSAATRHELASAALSPRAVNLVVGLMLLFVRTALPPS